MRETAKKARKSQILPEEDKEEIEAALRRMESKELARKNKEREARALKDWKKEEHQKRGEGKKEFYLKKGQSQGARVASGGGGGGLTRVGDCGLQRRRSRLCSRPSSTSWRRTRKRCARRSSASGKRRARRRRSSSQTGDERTTSRSDLGPLALRAFLFPLLGCNAYPAFVVDGACRDWGRSGGEAGRGGDVSGFDTVPPPRTRHVLFCVELSRA